MTTYLITGATGTLGRLATRDLQALDLTAEIVALARPSSDVAHLLAAGVDVRRGDFDDPSTLRTACEGIERALLVSSPVLDPTVRARQHLAFLDAAAAAGVAHLAYTSFLGADHDAGHLATEQALRERPWSCTVLRNGLYTEPFVERAWQEAVSTGVVRSAVRGHALRTASVHDLATAAARALADPRPSATVDLNGEPWTYDDLVRHIAARLGRPVDHQDVDPADLGAFGPLHGLFRAGLFAQPAAQLTAMIGRPQRTLAEVLEAAAGHDDT